jgi:hypothetical protein
MEALNPMSRGVSFDRSDVVCITELIRKYLKEYKDSTSVADWYVKIDNNFDKKPLLASSLITPFHLKYHLFN